MRGPRATATTTRLPQGRASRPDTSVLPHSQGQPDTLRAQSYGRLEVERRQTQGTGEVNTRHMLGDKIEELAKKTGAAALADLYKKTTGKDCGCAARKAKLNNPDLKINKLLFTKKK
jgi:hypothetical protein